MIPTPEQLALMGQVVVLLERVANWPFASLMLVLIIGPWCMLMALNYHQRRQLEQAIQLYKSNVVLVENYQALANDQRDIITLNTQSWASVKQAIEANEFCPLARSKRTSHQQIEYELKDHK